MAKQFSYSLDDLTRVSELREEIPESQAIRCLACAHRCRLKPGQRGICAMRLNRDGEFLAPWGYTSSTAIDPIEKKPFYHFLPGHEAFSFGMLGCNFRCRFCQNWSISQTLRDERALVPPRTCEPGALVAAAERGGSTVVASTYNEPLITSEWAAEIFRLARARGMRTCMISNGFGNPDVIGFLDPLLDAMNVDLKCYTDAGYKWLGGRLEPVKETIRALWSLGKWVEVITLVVPGFNDSEKELRAAAEFLAGVSPDLPWHLSAYHADYKMDGGPLRTPRETLEMAMRVGVETGIRYVYAGNVSGLSRGTDTLCPGCGCLLVARNGFGIRACRVAADGTCPECGAVIAGVWR